MFLKRWKQTRVWIICSLSKSESTCRTRRPILTARRWSGVMAIVYMSHTSEAICQQMRAAADTNVRCRQLRVTEWNALDLGISGWNDDGFGTRRLGCSLGRRSKVKTAGCEMSPSRRTDNELLPCLGTRLFACGICRHMCSSQFSKGTLTPCSAVCCDLSAWKDRHHRLMGRHCGDVGSGRMRWKPHSS